jgi:3-hydroxyisobutyrate dehydrogenase-like beta-hydroxyacid dehydrogenase
MKVGFIGLGDIGLPMALRIAKAGFELCVYDTRAEQLESVVQTGAFVAQSPAEVARRADLVCIVVRTSEQVRDVVLGDSGLRAGLRKGSIVVVHSTASREMLNELATVCADIEVEVLDAPISGGAAGARAGTLACLVGGSPQVLSRAMPVIQTFSKSVFHLGGIGAGPAGKLVNNLLYFVCMVGSRECMKLAAAAGIAEESAAAMIRASSGNNFTIAQWEQWKEHLREDGALERISALAHKDIGMALQMARELDVDVPLGTLAETRVEWAIDPGR